MGLKQWAFMQNVDMTHQDIFEQIKGSTKYHGTALNTMAPTAIMPYYNNELNEAQILIAVGDAIWKKTFGANEFTSLKVGLLPNQIENHVDISNKKYIAHPDGILEYDGISSIIKISNGPRIRDIVYSRETNRCFALDADIPNNILFTDDLTTTGGVPLIWNPLNASIVPPTDGDNIEKLAFLRGRLVIFMTNSTWIEYVNGNPLNWRYEKSPSRIGFIAPKTIRQVGAEFWGLGFSPANGIGVYAYNESGQFRLLSYDIENDLKRINKNKIKNACAEFVDNIYKLSVAMDSDIENETTFHFDVINVNQETQQPNIYGPHTYGFNCSAALDTKRFNGEHLFGKSYQGGSWIFKVEDVMTQYGTGITDDGELISTILLSPIYTDEGEYDETWSKRYTRLFTYFPSQGSWTCRTEVFTDYKSQADIDFDEFMEGNNFTLDTMFLGEDAPEIEGLSRRIKLMNLKGKTVQFKFSNTIINTKAVFDSFFYDSKPVSRHKEAQRVALPV